ncbi:MAG: DegQ family serine endoprotease [bacterium]|nr:DegQ family serine endoprotease [bacterium]
MSFLKTVIRNHVLYLSIVITGCSAVQSTAAYSKMLPSFSPIVKKTAPSVVNVRTSRTVKNMNSNEFHFRHPGFNIPDRLKPFFNKPFGGMPGEFKSRGIGSGVIISKDGYILTNNHVIEHADEIIVQLSSKKEYTAKVIGSDPKTDIALIKIESNKDSKKGFSYAKLGDSSKLETGDWVIAIGNPFGLDHTVTAGIVSAKGRREINPHGRQGYYNFIQTDASINPGNSGGPLIDMNGLVVGINTAINPAGQGIGFAIPINLAKKLIPQLKAKGKVTRSWIGVKIQKVTEELARSFGLKKAGGALVSEVVKGSPAEKAGIRNGDIILTFGGTKIKEAGDLPWLASMAGVGKRVKLTIFRGGARKTITMKLGELPDTPGEKSIERHEESEGSVLGIKVKTVPESVRKPLGLSDDEKGVIVTDAAPVSRAYEAGLRKGHVVLKLNGKPVTSPEDFIKRIKSIKSGNMVQLFIKLRGGTMYLAFTK